MSERPQDGRVRGSNGHRAVVLVGAALNGLFASFAMWLAGRHLGLESFEALAQLWTLWGLTATGLAFAFQQWEFSRSIDLPREHRRRVPAAVGLSLLLATAVTLAGMSVFRDPVFGSYAWVWPLAASTLPIGTALTGLAYATLARGRRYRALGATMALENAVRLVATVTLVLVGATATWYAALIPLGFIVHVVPLVRVSAVDSAGPGSRRLHAKHLPELAMVGFSKTFLVFGGPLLLGVAGGDAVVVSTLFLVLVVPRVPFLLVNAMVPMVTVQANEAISAGREEWVRRRVSALVGIGCVLALAGIVVGYAVGDLIADVAFEAGGQVRPLAYGLLGGATGLTLAATLTNPLLIALGRTRMVTASWALVVVSGTILTATGIVADEVVLTAWMLASALVVAISHVLFVRIERPGSLGP